MTPRDNSEGRSEPDFYRILTGAWAATDLEASLKVIAQGVCDVAGFGVSGLSVLRDSGQLEMVAVAGDPAAEKLLLGTFRPVSELEKDVADSIPWGDGLRFVPHEAVVGREDDLGWVADFEPLDHPDAWLPLNLLFALLPDVDGHRVGSLPETGRR